MHGLERGAPYRLGGGHLAFKAEPVDRGDQLLDIGERAARAWHQVIGRLGAERQAALRGVGVKQRLGHRIVGRGDLELQRRAEEAAAGAGEVVPAETGVATPAGTPTPDVPQALGTFTVQVATPDGRAFDGALAAVRGTAGVRGVAVSSTAIGGTSVLRVTYLGDLNGLAAALRAAGWQVNQGSNALGISR